jgi:hypothetical protein
LKLWLNVGAAAANGPTFGQQPGTEQLDAGRTMRFVGTLKQDLKMVEAAVNQPWSNGQSRKSQSAQNAEGANVWPPPLLR